MQDTVVEFVIQVVLVEHFSRIFRRRRINAVTALFFDLIFFPRLAVIVIDNDLIIQRRNDLPRRIRLNFALFVDSNKAFIMNRAMRAVYESYRARVGDELAPVCYRIDFVFGAPGKTLQDAVRVIGFFLSVRAEILPAYAEFASIWNARKNFVNYINDTPPPADFG